MDLQKFLKNQKNRLLFVRIWEDDDDDIPPPNECRRWPGATDASRKTAGDAPPRSANNAPTCTASATLGVAAHAWAWFATAAN